MRYLKLLAAKAGVSEARLKPRPAVVFSPLERQSAEPAEPSVARRPPPGTPPAQPPAVEVWERTRPAASDAPQLARSAGAPAAPAPAPGAAPSRTQPPEPIAEPVRSASGPAPLVQAIEHTTERVLAGAASREIIVRGARPAEARPSPARAAIASARVARTAPQPPRRVEAPSQAEAGAGTTVVQIAIGRIELRAATAQPVKNSRDGPLPPRMSLDEYLASKR
jgi:type IV secretory pathway VirB10-like protein